jgi:hypothetical protein
MNGTARGDRTRAVHERVLMVVLCLYLLQCQLTEQRAVGFDCIGLEHSSAREEGLESGQ